MGNNRAQYNPTVLIGSWSLSGTPVPAGTVTLALTEVFDEIGAAGAPGTVLTLPAGKYQLQLATGITSNNSRTSFIKRVLVGGPLYRERYGGDYARVAEGHNESGDQYSCPILSGVPFTLSIQLVGHGSGGGGALAVDPAQSFLDLYRY